MAPSWHFESVRWDRPQSSSVKRAPSLSQKSSGLASECYFARPCALPASAGTLVSRPSSSCLRACTVKQYSNKAIFEKLPAFSRFNSSLSGPFPALLLTNQRHHHALNFQFAGRNEIWIARVFCFEIGSAVLDDITFQRRLAVDQRGNNVAVMHVFGLFQNHNVPINDVR